MQKQTKFSIITPVYNTNKVFLEECLNSSINQDYDNYEIILVDDGSNQETKAFLDRYAVLPKIKLIHQENKGIVGARLTGIKAATGDYIYFLDSDDICNSNLLNILNNIAIDNNYPDIILHDGYRFKNSINEITGVNHFIAEGMVDKDVVINQLINLHINGVTNKIAKRRLFDSIENHIDKTIINGEDLQQSTYLILKANTFYQTYEKLEYYRFNEEDRDYYDVTKINEVNFLIPTYNMMFKNTDLYDKYIGAYKTSASKAVLYIAVQICWLDKQRKEIFYLLDELNKQRIVGLLKNINVNRNIVVNIIFNSLVNRNYLIIKIFSKFYKLLF